MERSNSRLRDTLEEDILTGAFGPGHRLEEQALALRYGVSRTPIREALIQLASVGLVEQKPRRGAVVAQIGPRRLLEMFEVMAEFEALAARHAARRTSEGDREKIEAAHQEASAAASAGDVDAYYYANERFHASIREAAGNTFLLEQAEALQKRLKPYRRLQLRTRDRLRASLEEHELILAALRAGDGDGAAAAMRKHVAVQGERFADLLISLESNR